MITPCAAPGCEEPAWQRCSTCKSVRYCGRECQRRHWSMEHKESCAALALRRSAEDAGIDLSQAPSPGRSSVGIVTIFDMQVQASTMTPDQLPIQSGGNNWELCPVVNMLGVPLAIKKMSSCQCKICIGHQSPIAEPTNQVATRLAIEPHTGMAPNRWLGGPHNHLGTVAVARTDGRDLGVQDWAILDDYIFNNIFDVWGMDPPDRQRLLPIVYSRHEFARYVAGRQDERLYH